MSAQSIVPGQSIAPLTGKAPLNGEGADVTKNLFNKTWWLFFHDLAALANSINNQSGGYILNVKDYGARGDGSTDDLMAINKAITFLNSVGGGGLFFPRGTYLISGSILMASNVALVGEPAGASYGAAAPFLPSKLQASPGFPANGVMIDNRNGVKGTGYYSLDIIGNGTKSLTQTDATSTGISFGTADQPDGGSGANCDICYCSIRFNKRNLWVKEYGTINALFSNFSCASYISVDAEKYALNDSTWTGCNINSNNWLLAGAGDPFTDIYHGVGLRLGFGCTAFSWLGGKIEYCGTGIVLDIASWGNHFTGLHFDANAKWHVRIIASSDPSDIQTIDHQFVNCRFNGGSYMNATNGYSFGLSGLDGHVLIEAPTTPFIPVRVGVKFTGNSFKAQHYATSGGGGLFEYDPNYPKWPQNNIVATRVVGTDVGHPDLRLLFIGNDTEAGSVMDGTATIAGTAVTRVTGNNFDSAWISKVFWQNLIAGRYAITAVADGSHLTISPTAGTISSAQPWYVETNRIFIDPLFSAFSDIQVLGNVSMPSYVHQMSVDQQDIFNLLDNAGSPVTGLDRNGNIRARARITGDMIVLQSDVAGLVYVGRYQAPGGVNYTGAVIDADDPAGTLRPTLLSLRLQGNENIQFNSAGIRIQRQVAIGGVVDPLYFLRVYGDTFVGKLFQTGSTAGAILLAGTGNPETVMVADPGSLYEDTANGVLYVKGSGTGNTGWLSMEVFFRRIAAGQIRTDNAIGINRSPGTGLDLDVNGQVRFRDTAEVDGVLKNDALTASRPVMTNASKELISSKVTLTTGAQVDASDIGTGQVPMSNGTVYFAYDLTTAITTIQSRLDAIEALLTSGLTTTVDTGVTPNLAVNQGIITGAS
jgi:hypothetical protein